MALKLAPELYCHSSVGVAPLDAAVSIPMQGNMRKGGLIT